MRVLVGCEESQVMTNEFRKLGHDAYSCDVLNTRGDDNFHFKRDIFHVLQTCGKWDLIILHPDCTYMAVSGNRWYGKNSVMYGKRLNSINWTMALWKLAKRKSKRVALENPVSVIFKYLPNVQYVQPWQFGHGETKKTGFSLYNLPRLVPTNIVEGREQRIWKMSPSPNRKRDRSETYIGIARACAQQWGGKL